MKWFMVILVGLALVIQFRAEADIIYVSGDVSGTWSADTVIVTGNISVPYFQSLTIEPGVKVLFEGYFNFAVQDDAILLAVGTEIDSILFDVLPPNTNWNHIHFHCSSDSSKLVYCHLTRGLDFSTTGYGCGGAVLCDNSSPTIRNCLIDNCSSSHYGGGIYLNDSNAIICNNSIIGDSANSGGGIYCHFSNPTINNNIIKGNLASTSGGGIVCEFNSNPLISCNTIVDNGGDGGGGIFIDHYSHPTICYNDISRNSYTGIIGGNIYTTYIYNNTICNNSGYGGVNGTLTITNCILWGNTPVQISNYANVEVTYSNIQNGWPGIGNIDEDPLFVDPQNGDYHLQSTVGSYHNGLWLPDSLYSPCIDAGDPESPYDNEPQPNGGRINMGAYGNTEEASLSNITSVSMKPNRTLIKFSLQQNYPNPFNPSTTISFTLPKASMVSLTVYDISGREVATLINGWRDTGFHEATFDGEGLGSSLYFYRLSAGEFTASGKMLLIK